jgi:hypothetical protein
MPCIKGICLEWCIDSDRPDPAAQPEEAFQPLNRRLWIGDTRLPRRQMGTCDGG